MYFLALSVRDFSLPITELFYSSKILEKLHVSCIATARYFGLDMNDQTA